jgi:hypothetical protein
MTPFNVVYGCDPHPLLKYEAGSSHVIVVDAQLRDRDELLEEIRERLLLSQDTKKANADKKCCVKEFLTALILLLTPW